MPRCPELTRPKKSRSKAFGPPGGTGLGSSNGRLTGFVPFAGQGRAVRILLTASFSETSHPVVCLTTPHETRGFRGIWPLQFTHIYHLDYGLVATQNKPVPTWNHREINEPHRIRGRGTARE